MKDNEIILLTGATGFLGSHLLRKFLSVGYSVIILKRRRSDTWRISDVLDKCTVYDIDDIPLRSIFKSHAIDMLVHTATSYGKKELGINDIVKSNLVFPLELLVCCEEFKVRSFFNTDTFFNTETTLPGNLNSYVLSKKHFLEYARNIIKLNKVQFINIRLEHLYGSKDNSSKFVPFIVGALLSNQFELNLTLGKQKRDFIHVDDVVSAYLLLMDCRKSLKHPYAKYELGSGKAIKLNEFVKIVHELTQSKTKLNFGSLQYRKNEIMLSEASIEGLTRLGWRAEMTLESGLCDVINYEKQRLGSVV